MLHKCGTLDIFIGEKSTVHLQWFGSSDSLGWDAAHSRGHSWRGRGRGLPTQRRSLIGCEVSGEGL